MGFVHNVEIAWNDLMDAFANGAGDRVYFLDRFTGEIFFVPTSWRTMTPGIRWTPTGTASWKSPALTTAIERNHPSGLSNSVHDPI